MNFNCFLEKKSDMMSKQINAPSILKAESSADCKPFTNPNFATGPFTAKKKSPADMSV